MSSMMPGGTFRLPESWSTPEVVEDVIVADDVAIHRAGLSTVGPDGEEMCGSAADPQGPALSRAWFELVERISALEALRDRRLSYEIVGEDGERVESWSSSDVFPESESPDRWRYARSNGIAIHVGWKAACRRALWELAERDRVVRAWHGEIAPELLPVDLAASALARAKSYEWCAYTFPERDAASFSTGV